MFVIMCEIRSHKGLGFPNETRFVSAHPVYAAKDEQEVKEWMSREPDIIVNYLNDMKQDIWQKGVCTEKFATIWNYSHTTERRYFAENVPSAN